ncbi:uncharacterized protein [Typha latifolia]|uniref:uncharacterized protein n=1 Tax=Typha latifolia TaxID=4733 RepID=UPI003C2B9955
MTTGNTNVDPAAFHLYDEPKMSYDLPDMTDDIMVRRIKNRERQRRYREKKRLEADLRKPTLLNPPMLVQSACEAQATTTEINPTGLSVSFEARQKNRDRQRRYRVKKQCLEAGTAKSCLSSQHMLIQSVCESTGTTIQINPSRFHASFEVRLYCGRKWKKDARKAYESKKPTDSSLMPVPLFKSPLEADSNLVGHRRPACKRRWKADARRRMAVSNSCENDQTI